jgi:uncharacterized membrane protein
MPQAELAAYRGHLREEGEQVRNSSGDAHDASSFFASNQQQQSQPYARTNVGRYGRYASVASGGLLAALGLGRRDKLGVGIAAVGAALIARGATGYCPLSAAMGVNNAEPTDPRVRREQEFSGGVRVAQAFTIGRSRQECYDFWRKLDNLPRIMSHIEEVRVIDDKRSHWIAKAPRLAGGHYEWDAEIVDDVPGERLAWRSLEGSDIRNAGVVRFEDSPRGTIARAEISYIPPGGKLGNIVVSLLGQSPDRVLREDLRNFKRVMEIGEPLTILGQSAGTCAGAGMRYAEKNSYLMPPTV